MVYDNRQFNNMRNDAIRRTREMYNNSMVNTSHYSQADNYRNNNRNNNNNNKDTMELTDSSGTDFKNENTKQEFNKNQNYIKSAVPENIGKLLSGKLDSEKLTIIALIIILAKEGADIKLILALGYILM